MTVILFAISANVLSASDLEEAFLNPPADARPGVYWYFMDGNQDGDEMVADLKAMNRAGIGSALFLEVNIGVPAGPVPFMSEKWQDNMVRAIKTTERLGMEFILGAGPGWAGSGGSWVEPEGSMKHLVGRVTQVQGPTRIEKTLPVPDPHKPNRFAGLNKKLTALRNKWYRDVAVLAFPSPEEDIAKIDKRKIKTLQHVPPYSINKKRPTFIRMPADYPKLNKEKVINSKRVIDLTSKMQPDGTLHWDVPEGDWIIIRFVSRSTGQTTRPAPRAGHGFEHDKFDADAFRRHWENYQGKLLEKLGPLTPGKGLTTIHLDSWEMSAQNWSAGFRKEFARRRGYDPQPFYPAYMGMVVDSPEIRSVFFLTCARPPKSLYLRTTSGQSRRSRTNTG